MSRYNEKPTDTDKKFKHNKYSAWARNVVDEYKHLSTEEINKILKEKSFPYAVLVQQWQGDFNLGTCVRNANAFGAREVFYIGRKKYDRRGTCGTHHYTNVNFLKCWDDLLNLKKIYPNFVGLDNIDSPKQISIENHVWKPNSLLIFGEESQGLTDEMIDLCDQIVLIPQHGSVRSLNAGVASGIAMYDFVSKFDSDLK